jgi:hypothetical protein
VLLLLFGLEWLCKGVLRTGGVRRRSSSYEEYAEERELLSSDPTLGGSDWAARLVAFKGVFLEALEVLVIVLVLAGSPGRAAPAFLGAAVALVAVVAVGLLLHAPLRRLPETRSSSASASPSRPSGRSSPPGPRRRVAARRRGPALPRVRVRSDRLARRPQAARRRPPARGGPAVMALLRCLRSLVLGETWAIPLGVAATLLIAAALRSELATHVWREDGGVVLATLVAVTLLASLRCELFARRSPRRRRS